MGWVAPATYSVSEIVLASKLNTHIRDNLLYLKGNAGVVTIEDQLTLLKASGDAILRIESQATGSVAPYIQLKRNTTGSVREWWVGMGINADDSYSIYDVTAAAFRMHITAAGNVGLGIATPTNRLHVKGSIVNWVFWEGDAIDGTARTVLANSSALYAQAGFAITRPSNGATPNVLSLNATSLLGATLYSVASDQCLLTAGSGGYIVQRTSGSLTYKVALVFMTL